MNRRTSLTTAVACMMVAGCGESIVNPGGGVPVAISWAPCVGSPDSPTWMAAQSGTGAWTAVTPVGGAFNFDLTGGRGGVAYVVGATLNVIYGTSTEIKAFAPSCAGAVRTVTGTVTGYASADDIDVNMGSGEASLRGLTTPSPGSITLTGVEPGAAEVLAVKSQTTVTISLIQTVPSSVLIRRGVSGNSFAPLDMNSSVEAGAPVSRLATISGAASGETIDVASILATATTSTEMSFYETALGTVSGTTSALYYALASTRLQAGDLQSVLVRATRQANNTTTDERFVSVAFTDATDQSLTMGPAITPPAITGSERPAVTYAVQAGYDKLWHFTLDQPSRSIDVIMTAGYLGTAPASVQIKVPDLSGASGFNPDWLMTTGTTTQWGFSASNGDPQTLSAAGPLGTFKTGRRKSSFVP